MNLSKSRYCTGIQCPKILWMSKNKPEQFNDDVLNQQILDTGNRIGDLAMGYFGEFSEVPYSKDKSLMIEQTRFLLESGVPVITEASFSYNGYFCSADILRAVGKHYDLIEVKSSTAVKNIYLHDMAYQYFVLRSCELNIRNIYLMHINNQYVRHGSLNLHELFVLQDCTDKVKSLAKASLPFQRREENPVITRFPFLIALFRSHFSGRVLEAFLGVV